MRKLLALSSVALVALTLVVSGCAKKEETSTSTSTETTTPAPAPTTTTTTTDTTVHADTTSHM